MGLRASIMKSFLCIGDIHGCTRQLTELLDAIHVELAAPGTRDLSGRIQWVFLGDYIDRGPDPAGVIENLRLHAERYPQTVYLQGNHEAMLFDIIECVGPDRAAAFLKAKGISQSNYEWLKKNVQYSFQSGDYFFTHAGLNPQRTLAEQTDNDFLWSYHEEEYPQAGTFNVVHGHITIEEVTIFGNNINVDTGCGKGGLLSAILLPERRVFQSESRGVNQNYLDMLKECGES